MLFETVECSKPDTQNCISSTNRFYLLCKGHGTFSIAVEPVSSCKKLPKTKTDKTETGQAVAGILAQISSDEKTKVLPGKVKFIEPLSKSIVVTSESIQEDSNESFWKVACPKLRRKKSNNFRVKCFFPLGNLKKTRALAW